MPSYAIRVELIGNPSAERYESLHALMARLGLWTDGDRCGQAREAVDGQSSARHVLRIFHKRLLPGERHRAGGN
jgi:hypothetical protein